MGKKANVRAKKLKEKWTGLRAVHTAVDLETSGNVITNIQWCGQPDEEEN